MFKVFHECVPAVFSELFTFNHDIHSYETRQAQKLHVPIARTNYMSRCISVKGVQIWNKLHDHVNYNCSLLTYKVKLKIFLIAADDIEIH